MHVHEHVAIVVLVAARRACWWPPWRSAATFASATTRGTLLADNDGMLRVLLIVVVCQVVPALRRPLRPARRSPTRAISSSRLLQALGATSLILGVVYFWFPTVVIGRGVFLHRGGARHRRWSWPGGSSFALADEARWRRASGCCSSAPSPAAIALARELFERRQELGVEIVGFVDPDPAGSARRSSIPACRHDRRHPALVARLQRRPRGGQPDRCARQAADGPAARHAAAKRRHVRSSGVGVRGIHRQDRRREPAPELADLLRRLPQDARCCWPPSARSTSSLRGRRPDAGAAAHG